MRAVAAAAGRAARRGGADAALPHLRHMVDADQMDAHSRECRLDVVVFNAEQRLAKLQRAIEREISSRRSPPLRPPTGRHRRRRRARHRRAVFRGTTAAAEEPIASMLGKFPRPLSARRGSSTPARSSGLSIVTTADESPPSQAGSPRARRGDALLQLLQQTCVEALRLDMDRARCEEMLVDARELRKAARGIRGSPRASPAPARREVPGGSGKLDGSGSGSGKLGDSNEADATIAALAEQLVSTLDQLRPFWDSAQSPRGSPRASPAAPRRANWAAPELVRSRKGSAPELLHPSERLQALKAQGGSGGSVKGHRRVPSGGRPNEVNISAFEILKPISRGAYGRVVLAAKRTTRDLYAIKVIRKKDLQRKNQIEHIKTEREVMAHAEHPFVVRLYYSFTSADNLYMVMEFVNGGDLFSLLRNVGYLAEEVARLYVAEISLASSTSTARWASSTAI